MHGPGALKRACFGACVLPLLMLAACASAPPGQTGSPAAASAARTAPAVTPQPGPTPGAASAASAERDGVGPNPLANITRIPDAEPPLEPIRSGGANKPYEALGQTYTPQTRDLPFTQRGLASWYGRKFHGRRTASGEVFDMYGMTAAHRTLPLPSYVRVRNPANGAEVVLRVNDRGPFHSSRIIDLSYAAALTLGVAHGVAPVEVVRITADDIRTGVWRQGRPADTRLAGRSSAAPPAAATAPVAAAAVDAQLPAEPPVVLAPAALESPSAPAAAPVALPGPLAADASPPGPQAAVGFWVQLGAFQKRSGADTFHSRVVAELDWLAPVLAVISDPKLFRLQAGPYSKRDEALDVARRVREALQLVPLVLERR